jgi:hypothetical protein
VALGRTPSINLISTLLFVALGLTLRLNRGLGALSAEKFASEGSNIAINYMSNKEVADKLALDIASKYKVKTVVIQGVWLPYSNFCDLFKSLSR